MKIATYIALFFSPLLLIASDKVMGVETVTASATTVIGSIFSRSDEAIAKSIISGHRASKGAFGEAIVNDNFMSKVLSKGNWKSISPRIGPQGIDHVFLELDPKTNLPKDLIVGESKYGSSQLGKTKDGMQMGNKWLTRRLQGLAKRYLDVSNVQTTKAMPKYPHYKLSVHLSSGKEAFFWKESSTDTWKFGGDPKDLPEAQLQAKRYGNFISKAADGTISYRSRIFHIDTTGDDVIITIKNAANVDNVASLSKLQTEKQLILKGALREKIAPELKGEIFKKLKPHLKIHDEKEIAKLTADLVDNLKAKDFLKNYGRIQIARAYTIKAGFVGIAAMTIDAGIQLTNGQFDAGTNLLIGTATTTGMLSAQSLNALLIRSQIGQRAIGSLASGLGVSSSKFALGISSIGGGIITGGIISYGQYFMGYTDLETANKNMAAVLIGSSVAEIAGMGTMAAISAFGTASTGTAISTLSGAAATNAILAWLGGGSIATGGGGAALGSVVLTGGTIVIAIVATTVVYVVYDQLDKHDKAKDTELRSKLLRDEDVLKNLVNHAFAI